MESKFRRRVESLDRIFEFIRQFTALNRIDESLAFSITFVVEELFTNMVKYNSSTRDEISLALEKNDRQIVVRLIDYDVEPFDVSTAPDAKVDDSLKQRKIGGLGIYLVKRIADNIKYEYVNRESRITVIKNLEKEDVQSDTHHRK